MEKKKNGLFALGLVKNSKSYCEDLVSMLSSEESADLSPKRLNELVDEVPKEYLNGFGYPQFADRSPVTEEKARYIRFCIGLKNNDGDDIYGWFCRPSNKPCFQGVEWGTLAQFDEMIVRNRYFTMGNIYFEEYKDGLEFIEDIASSTIGESWKYKNHPSKINHPILKSYIENILLRLQKEYDSGKKNKFIFSKNKEYVMFNLNLLDKYFHDVIIAGRVENKEGHLFIHNPFRVTSTQKMRAMGFSGDIPTPPQFFEDVNEVIFRTDWKIDQDFDAYTHILEERKKRFPEAYIEEETETLARKLDDAIKYAVAMAQRNYKFIVPMYRPQEDKIQLLMPIYLKGTYSKRPDFALVLTPDSKHKVYSPETILPLDAAYQNARLIAKPDEAWLNPEEM